MLHPLVRDGPKGEGRFRRASWDEALDRVASELRRVRDEAGGEAILPYSYAGTQGLIQGNTMSARVMNALGATELERTICATAGLVGCATTHGVSPEVDPEEWPHARHLLVWGWNPMSTAPHLWRKLLEARRAGARLVVVDPFRSRTARVADEHLRPIPGTDAALAIGMMRAVRGRRPRRTRTGAARTPRATTSCWRVLAEHPVERCAEICGVDADDHRPHRARVRDRRGPRCCGSGSAPSATSARRPPTRTIASLPALTGAWRDRGGGCSYIPTATAARRELAPARAATTCVPARCARSTCPSSATRSPTPSSTRRSRRSSCWNSNPASIAPDQERVLAGLRARGPVHRRARAVHDRHGRARRRGAARHDPARAPRRGLLLGPPLPDLERAGDRAARRGQAEHRGLPAARRAPRARRPVLPRDATREMVDSMLAASPAVSGRDRGAARARLGSRSTWARAARRTPRAASGTVTRQGEAARPLRAARRGGRRGAGRALPAGAHHAEDPPLPQLDVREPGAPALGPAGARGGRPSRRRAGARHRRRRARARVQRPRRRSAARRACPTTPAPAWWWRRWAGGTATTRAGAAARPPPRRRSPRRATRRSSTTTAWRSRRSSPRPAPSPAARSSSFAARMRPTASSRRAREMRPRRTAASTAS